MSATGTTPVSTDQHTSTHGTPTPRTSQKELTMTSTQQTPLHDISSQGYQDRPAPRKLTRNTSDKMLGGVSSGLADYLNVDVTIVRLAFVGLTIITGGVGAIGYLAGWIVIPEDTG